VLANNLLVLAALAATAAPVPSEDASGLRWKFEKGRTFYQEMTTHVTQTMTVMGQEVKQTQNQTFVLSWTPEKQDGDRWVLRQKVEAVKLDIDVGGNRITYDSTDPKAQKDALGTFFAALVGSEFRVTLDKGFKVHKVEGREELVKKLAADKPETETLLRGLLSDDALKEMANPMLITAPRREVDKGDYWVQERRLDMGPVGAWVGRWQYVHMGKQDKLIKLKLEAIQFDYQPPRDPGAGGLPFAVKATNFKTKNTAGTVLFDPDKGRLHSAETGMDFDGELTVEIGGQETKIHLIQSQKTTYKVSDTNPALKK
jgi:hypothetical protein